ncbi:MAG: cation transporter [Candidatus Raymondbacteria bacterium RifOxyA12_full_50_37]|uniref:Cation transporter n=1 Tax=Candidatus Raymondbacteria bacterium RIFOXYD12_FULL_49_13 TaxID=1817890 RepID=A0A1F7FHD2_UNCRA|nr:MAG: cation transporter [Candidatus Raymondbacteria bacterium RifOxyA12_full_50_37]OGJ89311.1 MAG: cation transporter [Candidatus Raymondbacteria bacterium RIFOXYA2_FULL_49_16]OGK00720.1 MAG: cation transporter [Candidatus Raymondbacteria bacterium RifOxyB12_full_50_8]OGK04969.1 MAG: cation transporter [Candidatus Raymondbacteria bacterium RifOxyC12_full_50_8]OGK06080.1 MAG: cation transporter [Candidatus Raymondbacteria bacterium RIFOXYD12_FULL_49_13]OGP42389.1 MAG: cation transporter [Can
MLKKIIEWSVANKIIVLLAGCIVAGLGIHAVLTTPIDAIPDLSDVQVIVYTEYPGQSPRVVEDQVTYPLTTALISVPGSRIVRGYSFFGYSLVYIIFDDGTDMYWARSRVLEYLNYAQKNLPSGITPTLGPDATGVGWVFEYALTSKKRSLAELRSLQDWYLKYELASVPGVSEVASVGGYVKQYQVTLDPARLQAYGISSTMVEMAIKNSNSDAGGETVEMGEMEFMVRGKGYLTSLDDIKNIPVMLGKGSMPPVYLSDVATIAIGPEMRRGAAELDGMGEVVGGIVIIRFGENARTVIEAVKRKLVEVRPGLPEDVSIVTTYDRSGLINRAISHLRDKLVEEIIIVALVCLVFLMHARSAFVAVFTLPLAILMGFIVMRFQGISANIMSLGGIAIAIGAMVDAAIIMIENMHKHLETEELLPLDKRRTNWAIAVEAAVEVGPTLFFSLIVITVSFLPVFTLEAQEGRLFKPLAFTKTYSMAAAALLSVTVVPILMGFFIRGKILPENKNRINRVLHRIYEPVVQFVVTRPKRVIGAAALVLCVTLVPITQLGSEFMPPLWEGDLLYMPTTLPGISITKARELLQQTDRIIKQVPEVQRVFGKVGRAETATDPAGLDMIESTILLKPQKEWRKGMTRKKLIAELDNAIRIPGLTDSWTMPIKTRIDMLSTGIKTPVGVKISGPNLDSLQSIGARVEAVLRDVPGTASAYAERPTGGNYLDISINRREAGRYGLSVEDIQSVIRTAIGGMDVTTTVEGLERYGISVRYGRELRANIDDLKRVLVPAPGNAQVPLGLVAEFSISKGPMVVRTENARPNSWVFVDIRDIDIGSYVAHAQQAIARKVSLPAGYSIAFSGEFEYMERMRKKLMVVIPLTLAIVVMLLFLNTRSLAKTGIVLLAVPFSLAGAFWAVYLLGYDLSLAVWVGMIALAGLDAETGVVMLLYLEQAFDKAKKAGAMRTLADLRAAIDFGAVKRVRPKIMTASVIVAGLLPIMWSNGAGADVMKRIAAPMVGGIVTSVAMELLVYPAVYFLWKKRETETREKSGAEGS